jgi:hypothetical protein
MMSDRNNEGIVMVHAIAMECRPMLRFPLDACPLLPLATESGNF